MRAGSGNTVSLWQATAQLPSFEPLRTAEPADVVVVGAGITGLSCAYRLAESGRRVLVLDQGGIGNGETARTSAHLASALDDRFHVLAHRHGAAGAQLAAQSHSAAIDYIERIVVRERIDCDFQRVPGYLVLGDNTPAQELASEAEAAAHAGLDVALLDAFAFNRGAELALRFANQAQFHPLRYLAGLAQACVKHGVRIHTHTNVVDVRGGLEPCVSTADGIDLPCRAAIVATNTPVNDRVVIHTKQAAYRTFAIALGVDGGLEPCLIWDTNDPYHYVRSWHDRERDTHWLIVGGEDHKTGQPGSEPERAFARLRDWAAGRFGVSGEVAYAWSGQVLEPVDGLAFIGRNPADHANVYIATGDSGNGLTHGTIAALLLGDLIEGRANAWEGLYGPARKSLHGLGDYVRENANVAAQYADLVTPGEIDNAAALAPGQAAILREGLHKLALYRDFDGRLHAHSAACTHLGCVVHWNGVEKTWDCPCHGSRFDPHTGAVLNGPALAPLESKTPKHA